MVVLVGEGRGPCGQVPSTCLEIEVVLDRVRKALQFAAREQLRHTCCGVDGDTRGDTRVWGACGQRERATRAPPPAPSSDNRLIRFRSW